MKTKRFFVLLLACILLCALTLSGCNSKKKTYEEAIAAKAAGDYDTAIALFEEIPDYEGVPTLLEETKQEKIYYEAEDAYHAKEYDKAMKLLRQIPSYPGSIQLQDDVLVSQIKLACEEKQFENALELAAQISDSSLSEKTTKNIKEKQLCYHIATLVYSMVNDSSFNNPSTIRVLRAGANRAENDFMATLFKSDFAVYLELQFEDIIEQKARGKYAYIIFVGGQGHGQHILDILNQCDDFNAIELPLDASLINENLDYIWAHAS